nr:MAG TPA: hypothetical protein [Caudoviricetes sp.]
MAYPSASVFKKSRRSILRQIPQDFRRGLLGDDLPKAKVAHTGGGN